MLADALPARCLAVPLLATTAEEAVDELLALLPFDDEAVVAEIRASVLSREAESATGLGRGVALPHGRTTAVDAPICALGIAPDGLEFGAPDGELCHVVLLCVTNPDDPSGHLQLISEIAGLLNDPERHARLTQARARDDALAALEVPAAC